MSEKTYGQVLYEKRLSILGYGLSWIALDPESQYEHEQEARAVISEFLVRSVEPVAYRWASNEGIAGSPLTHYGDCPPGYITNAEPLFLAPQPLPSVEEIKDKIRSLGYTTNNQSWDIANEVLNLLKGGDQVNPGPKGF